MPISAAKAKLKKKRAKHWKFTPLYEIEEACDRFLVSRGLPINEHEEKYVNNRYKKKAAPYLNPRAQ